MRVINFDEEGITGDEFLVVNKVEDSDKDIKGQILTNPKCIYTIIEDGRWLNGEKNIDDKVGDSIKKIAFDNGYELLGVAYVNLLLTTYEEELERKFIEVYVPIK